MTAAEVNRVDWFIPSNLQTAVAEHGSSAPEQSICYLGVCFNERNQKA
jgi:hypothetical protein